MDGNDDHVREVPCASCALCGIGTLRKEVGRRFVDRLTKPGRQVRARSEEQSRVRGFHAGRHTPYLAEQLTAMHAEVASARTWEVNGPIRHSIIDR